MALIELNMEQHNDRVTITSLKNIQNCIMRRERHSRAHEWIIIWQTTLALQAHINHLILAYTCCTRPFGEFS